MAPRHVAAWSSSLRQDPAHFRRRIVAGYRKRCGESAFTHQDEPGIHMPKTSDCESHESDGGDGPRPLLDAATSTGDLTAQLRSLAQSSDRADARQTVLDRTNDCLATTGRGLDLTSADLSGLDLSGFDLRRATLNRAALFGTNLTAADLSGASLVCAGLERTDFTAATLCGAYVHALAAQASVFVGADLTELVDATGAMFHGCDMTGARLDRSELAGVSFYQCNLLAAQAHRADLRGATFNECRMDDTDLTAAVLDDCTITRCSVRGLLLNRSRGRGLVIQRPSCADGLQLSAAQLGDLRLSAVRGLGVVATGLSAPGIDVLDSQLLDADFADALLAGGRWSRVCLDSGNFTGAVLSDSLWNQVSGLEVTLADATGESMTASDCSFVRADFTGFAGRYATFRNCDLHEAGLRRAYLYRSSFIGDPPTSACMTSTNLEGANLTQAYLAADFTGASLRHAIATYARVNQSVFADADLVGLGMFRASAVKTDFTTARVSGTLGTLFADRCAGLYAALDNSDDPNAARIARFVAALEELISGDGKRST
ncbi:pentapeptide repeat-containing protein [Nocardia colli]|uniref:pentapeptide repeat-containing protein n=1 Tax=Nocardia colli TaxID=2545717 RepID=UPI0035DE5264